MWYFKLVILVLFFWGSSLFAQDNDILTDLAQPSENGGVVLMESDSLLSGLITLQREVNSIKGGVDGFRVQLYRGNDMQTSRQEAGDVKALFLEKHPDATVYTYFQAPFWIVRVGNFRSYGEALKLRNQLEHELSQIKDDIYIVPSTVKIN